ncbi:T9SS type A sorting domain-containing protein [candidate division WOR-3 bacterium]|nr:T9SS type A sorting domain-containing protein [candidate division WOR-3 bacterium]
MTNGVLRRIGAGLLLAGVLLAGQAGVQNQMGMLLGPRPLGPVSRQATPSPGSPALAYDNDVGVTAIIPMLDIYVPFGDTLIPRCVVENHGFQTQTNVPVSCVIFDTAAGARVYGPETIYVASLGPFTSDTVEFSAWVPEVFEHVYFDTMATFLAGDQNPNNDWRSGRITVSNWGEAHLTYNDGTFEQAYTWVQAGSEFTVRFFAPERPLTLSKAVLWLASYSGADYDAEVRVYGNDGDPHGDPGTQLGVWAGQLHTEVWMYMHMNEVWFDPPVEVDYDTFFVSYCQSSILPNYPFLGVDQTLPCYDGNDWGWFAGTKQWGLFSEDWYNDFAIDACYDAPLLDGSPKEITVPPGSIDSNTTFIPQVVIKNAGLCDRANIAAEFVITSSADGGDTVYAGTANSGPIQAGETKTVTFLDSITPEPGSYTMTSITLLPYDGRPGNDTLVRPLAVGRPGIAAQENAVGRASFTITPNPLGRFATVRYSVPGAGAATLDVYDATGREVLSQMISVERAGVAILDLRRLEAGVYIVRAKTDGFCTTQKLVVER